MLLLHHLHGSLFLDFHSPVYTNSLSLQNLKKMLILYSLLNCSQHLDYVHIHIVQYRASLTVTSAKFLAGMICALWFTRNCSVISPSFIPMKRFSYSEGSASDWAALALVLPRDSFHSFTTLQTTKQTNDLY